MTPPAPLLLRQRNFEGSIPNVASLNEEPLLKSSLECLKELLRVGGVGAFFFFFLIKLIKGLRLVLDFGSSFRLPSTKSLSFRGSIGDTATSASAPSGNTKILDQTHTQDVDD